MTLFSIRWYLWIRSYYSLKFIFHFLAVTESTLTSHHPTRKKALRNIQYTHTMLYTIYEPFSRMHWHVLTKEYSSYLGRIDQVKVWCIYGFFNFSKLLMWVGRVGISNEYHSNQPSKIQKTSKIKRTSRFQISNKKRKLATSSSIIQIYPHFCLKFTWFYHLVGIKHAQDTHITWLTI